MPGLTDQLNAAVAALNAIESGTRMTMFAERDNDGNIQPPSGTHQFDVTLISDAPDFDWDKLKSRSAVIQVDAYAKVPTESLRMLDDALPAMIAAGFQPIGTLRARPAPPGWTGHSQDFEKGFI